MIAMDGGSFPRVAYIDAAWSFCSQPFHVKATDLIPQPMRYYMNEVPR